MSWTARNRTTRSPRPDAGADPDMGRDDDSWYEPQRRAPAWRGEPAEPAPRHADRGSARDQLNAVADQLERLMDGGEAPQPARAPHSQPQPNRKMRRAAAARARTEGRPAPTSEAERRTSRIEAVLGALDRLDRRVEDLSQAATGPAASDTRRGDGAPADGYDADPYDAAPYDAAPYDADPYGAEAYDPSYDVDPYDADPYMRAGHEEERVEAMRRDRSAARHAARSGASGPQRRAPHGGAADDDFDRQEREAMAARAPERRRSARGEPVPAVVAAELGEELRPLFQDLARKIERAGGPQDVAVATLRRDIAELRNTLMESLRAERGRASPRDAAEMRRLSDAVERLRADRSDMRVARELRAEIADLRSLIGQSNVDGMLQSLESGYAHLVQRLDELARDRAEPRLLEDLGQRLAEIEDAFRIVPRADQLVALDDRVADIGHRVEELVRRNAGPELETLRGEVRGVRDLVERLDVQDLLGGIEERLSTLSVRLDSVEQMADDQRAMRERLEQIDRRLPASGAVDRLNDRLEEIAGMLADDRAARAAEPDPRLDQQLDEIAGRLKRIENARQMPPSYDAAFTLLEKRLTAIDSKIDALDRPETVTLSAGDGRAAIETDLLTRLESGIADLTRRLDGAQSSGQGPDLDRLHAEIAALREGLASPGEPQFGNLEAQVRDLAEAVSRSSGRDDGAALAQIESKIAALAEKLDAAEHGFARLDDLHPGAQSGVSGEIMDALRGDLHRLMDAATSSERKTRESMDSVQSVLASINQRLVALEQDRGADGAPLASPEDDRPLEPGSGKPQPRPRIRIQEQQRAGTPVARARPAQKGAPGGDPAGDPPARAPRTAQAAGPQATDAQAGGAQAGSAERGEGAQRHARSNDPRDRKADFIAAARRAAQAAAAEVDEPKSTLGLLRGRGKSAAQEGEDTAGRSAAGWLRSRLSGRRKGGREDEAESEVATPATAERRDGGRGKGAPRADEAAAAPSVRADARPTDLAGDEAEQAEAGGRRLFSPGGRRAVLLAAAAVVIAIGALQIFKQVGPGGSDGAEDLAALDTPPVIEQVAQPQEDATSRRAPDTPATLASASGQTGAQAGAQTASNTGSRAGPTVERAQRAATGAPEGPTATEAGMPGSSASPAQGIPSRDMPAQDAGAGEAEMAFAPPAVPQAGFSANPDTLPTSQFQGPADAGETGMGTGTPGASDALAGIPESIGPLPLRQAAAQGDPNALFAVAVRYTEGKGVTPDLAEAARYYRRAAEAGLAPAQYRLGSLYEKGRGVERDLEAARDWYARAAKQGNAKASHNLAVLYAEGISGNPEFRDAAHWFKTAANFGLTDSQYNLGILYARGLGLEKNLVESYKWFALAAEQGDADAANKRDELANMLSKEQLAEARLAVETWQQAPQSASANTVEMSPSWSAPAAPVSQATMTGDPRTMVLQAQKLLAERGFDPGTPDGQVGPRTREAIRAFQAAAGLPVTGHVTPALVEALSERSI